jgi:Bacterial Ig-like domain
MSWAHIQGTSGHSSGSVANYAKAFTNNVTAGNTLIASVGGALASLGAITVQDSTGTYTFTQDGSESGNVGVATFHLTAPTTGAFTVKATPANAGLITLAIDEFSSNGLAAAGTAAVAGASSGTSVGTAAVPVSGNCLLYGALGNISSTAPTAGSGFTPGSTVTYGAGANYGLAPEWILNQDSNLAVAWTQSNAIWAAVGIAYKETPVGFTFTGPTSGTVGVTSTNFTITPSAMTTDTVTLSGGAGGTFTPTSLSWNQSSSAQTFTYTPAAGGVFSLAGTSANGATASGSPITFTVPGISVSPTAIPANHAGNITLTVTGVGSAFTSGTPGSPSFTLSGVAGVTKVSQTVTSSTSATIVVTTGSGTGTLTISDGIVSATLAVNATTFTLSPATGIFGHTGGTITATGSAGSNWTHETAGTLFSAPGTNGDSISSITVVNDTTATFTLNPGTTPAGNLVVTATPTGAAQNFAIVGPTCLRVLGEWQASTASNNLMVSQTSCSFSYFVKVNTFGTNLAVISTGLQILLEAWSSAQFASASNDALGSVENYGPFTFAPGVAYHVALSWDGVANTQKWYINGQLLVTATDTQHTRAGNSSTTVGWSSTATVDVEFQDVAIWNGYALSQADVQNLRNGTSTPGTLGTKATTWWPFYGQQGSAPASFTDIGFTDAIGSNSFTSFSSTPSNSLARYDAPLAFIPPVQVTPYITKSGQNACFGFATNYANTTSLSGTVSISTGSRALSTSVPQSNFVGQQITIAGDSSSGTYRVIGGSGNNWTVTPAFGGSSRASGAAATNVTQNVPVGVTNVSAQPTINVQFGGAGSFESVQLGDAFFLRTSNSLPCVFFPLECGGVASVIVQNHGAGYSSPSTSITTPGSGSGLVLGTPVMTGGVTSFTITSGGSGWNVVNGIGPTLTIPPPTISFTGTLTAGSTSVTGISSTAGFVPGMMITGAEPQGTAIASVVSSTAITLCAPAAYSGSTALVAYGKQAIAVPTLNGSGVVTGITVWSPGTGYTGSSVTGTLSPATGGTGSGGSIICHITNVIAAIPVTNPGSGYTKPPTITISDGGSGTGATAVVLMSGVGPTDVAVYSAVDSWASATNGPVGAATNVPVANYSGQNEPGFGTFLGFNLPSNEHLLGMGVNLGHTYVYGAMDQANTNWMNRIPGLPTSNTGVSTVDPGGRPILITGTSSAPTKLYFFVNNASNFVDGVNTNSQFPTIGASGVNGNYWTLIADDTDPENPNALVVGMFSYAAAAAVSAALVTPGTSSSNGVNSITLGTGGSGYLSPPTVTIVGGGGTGATACAFINSNGQVYWLSITSVGSGYTSTPTVVFSGGNGGRGATATVTTGRVTIGNVWQFTVEQNTFNFDAGLALTFYRTGLTGSPPYNYTLVNECLFDPPTTAASYPLLPSRSTALDMNLNNRPYMTSASYKYPAVLRCMEFENTGPGGSSSVVDYCDIPQLESFCFGNDQVITSTPVSLANAPTFSRNFTVSAIRTYALSPSCIAGIYPTAVGSGYSGTVQVTFLGGGSGATGYATVTNGEVVGSTIGGVPNSVTITSGGSGYSSGTTGMVVGNAVPGSIIGDGTTYIVQGGSGATFAVTIVGGVVTAATIVAAGSNYSSILPITITDSAGTGAIAYATVSPAGTISGGGIAAVNVTNGGSSYTSAPTVAITGGGGSGGVVTATIDAITGVVTGTFPPFNTPGTGYTTIPSVGFSGGGGSGATATAILNGITVTAGGSGYVSPTAHISGGGGTGATLVPVLGYPSGVIGGITVTASGSGYTSAPTVTISGSGSGAIVTANILNGGVVSFNILNMGSGYTGTPTVSFSGGGGSGATATAQIWDVNWTTSPNVYFTDAGTGTSTLVPNPSWTGYGSGSAGGPFMVRPGTPTYLNPWPYPNGELYVGEMVTSAPHNLKTGQVVNAVSGSGTYSIAISQTAAATGFTPGGSAVVYVTGPTTFAFIYSNGTPPYGDCPFLPGHVPNVSGTFPVNYTFSVQAPNTGFTPYEIQARYIGSLPGTDYWASVPECATNTCARIIAATIRDNFPMGRKVWVEFHNEHFNTAGFMPAFMGNMGQLGAWSSSSLTQDQAYTERARQIHNIFVSVFNETDINGNSNRGGEIVRVFGSWFVIPEVTTAMISYANAQGIQVDAVCVANYYDIFSDSTSPTVAATVVAGSASTGTLPAGNYYAYYTWVDGLSHIESDVGTSQSAQFTVTGASGSANIPVVTIPAFPSWGVGTANIYLTPANGAPGTETLFTSGITGTTVSLNAATWSSTPPPKFNLQANTAIAAAMTATNIPSSPTYGYPLPRSRASYLDYLKHMVGYESASSYTGHQQALNLYSVGSNPIPLLVGYEGGLELIVPTYISGVGAANQPNPLPLGNYLKPLLTADLTYDPAMYDVETAYYLNCQQGGLTLTNIFNWCSGQYVNYGDGLDGEGDAIWPLFLNLTQPMGRGNGSMTSAGYDVTNIFAVDTQLSPHNFDASVRVQAWNDWIDQSSPFIVPGDVFVTPANGATGVSPRVVIVVQFNEPMLGSTINNSTFVVRRGGASVGGTIAYSPITFAATFTPASSLNGSATYTVQLTTGVKNAQGTALAIPITWSFATGGGTSVTQSWFPGLKRSLPRVMA